MVGQSSGMPTNKNWVCHFFVTTNVQGEKENVQEVGKLAGKLCPVTVLPFSWCFVAVVFYL